MEAKQRLYWGDVEVGQSAIIEEGRPPVQRIPNRKRGRCYSNGFVSEASGAGYRLFIADAREIISILPSSDAPRGANIEEEESK